MKLNGKELLIKDEIFDNGWYSKTAKQAIKLVNGSRNKRMYLSPIPSIRKAQHKLHRHFATRDLKLLGFDYA